MALRGPGLFFCFGLHMRQKIKLSTGDTVLIVTMRPPVFLLYATALQNSLRSAESWMALHGGNPAVAFATLCDFLPSYYGPAAVAVGKPLQWCVDNLTPNDVIALIAAQEKANLCYAKFLGPEEVSNNGLRQ